MVTENMLGVILVCVASIISGCVNADQSAVTGASSTVGAAVPSAKETPKPEWIPPTFKPTEVADSLSLTVDEPTPQRVIACRAAERAFASSPKPLVVEPDGNVNRVPTTRELAAYEDAMYATLNLATVESQLDEMYRFFFQRVGLLRAVISGDKESIRNAAGLDVEVTVPDGSTRSPLGMNNSDLLNSACASVGSLTNF